MLMDTPAVRRVAKDSAGPAGAVNDAAVRVDDALRGFDTANSGREYRSAGEQLGRGLDDLRRSLFTRCDCVRGCGSALQADQQRGTDLESLRSSASVLGEEVDGRLGVGEPPSTLGPLQELPIQGGDVIASEI